MSYTVDANILLYAANEDSPYHEEARNFIETCALKSESWCLTWIVVHAFIRISTHAKIMDKPLSPQEAIGFVDQIVKLPQVRVVGEDDSLFWDLYGREVVSGYLRGNQIPDAIIVAIMKTHGIRTIYTRDRDFLRFKEIKMIDPLL